MVGWRIWIGLVYLLAFVGCSGCGGGDSGGGAPSDFAFTTASPVSVAENRTVAVTLATANGTPPVVYALSGGADRAAFALDANTGVLSFNVAPDYELPADTDQNNRYEVEINATDGTGQNAVLLLAVNVNDVNENQPDTAAPIFQTNAAQSIPENATAVVQVQATDASLPITYTLSGGADQALFDLDSATGALSFKIAPDYENPVDQDGNNVYLVVVTATDNVGNSADLALGITVTDVNEQAPDTTPPVIISSNHVTVSENTTAVMQVQATDDSGSVVYAVSGGADGALFTINASSGDLAFLATPDYENPGDANSDNVYEVQVQASDPSSNKTTQTINVTVTDVGETAPVVIGQESFEETYKETVPADATKESYDEKRFCIVSGRVFDKNAAAMPGVTISFHHQEEYGSVVTDENGSYALATEGGGVVTVMYVRDGYTTAHRKVDTPKQDFVVADDVVLLPVDSKSTDIDLGKTEVQVHRSTPVTDDRGSRAAALVFDGVTKATVVSADGNRRELQNLTVRATEFERPDTMPAPLPANSGFTYCVDLRTDGVGDDESVEFDAPVIMYVENFLDFDVGGIVPVGYYDRNRERWVASENGVVVKLLDTDASGSFDALDATGDDQADDLDGDGNLSSEVAGILGNPLYVAGNTYWRASIRHFTPWDLNWPYGPPQDAIRPPVNDDDERDDELNRNNECTNSYVTTGERIYHDDIPLPETGMALHFAGDRVPGFRKKITIRTTGDVVPASLRRIGVTLDIGGKRYRQDGALLPNDSVDIFVDGKDMFGRQMRGRVTGQVTITYTYPGIYYEPDSDDAYAFGKYGVPDYQRQSGIYEYTQTYAIAVDAPDFSYDTGQVARGWSLSKLHKLYPARYVIATGDGNVLDLSKSGIYGETDFAGKVNRSGSVTSNDEGNASDLVFGYSQPAAVVVDAAGNVYAAAAYTIWKIDPDGHYVRFAGTGSSGYAGDGGAPTDAKFSPIIDMELDQQGGLYVLEGTYNNAYHIRKIADGVIHTVASIHRSTLDNWSPYAPSSAEGLLSIALDDNKNLYVGTSFHIRRFNEEGNATSVIAGMFPYTNERELYPDNMDAMKAELDDVSDIVVDKDGVIYYLHNYGIAALRGDGTAQTIALFNDDDARNHPQFINLEYANSFTLDSIGNIYVATRDYDGNRFIERIDASGTLTRLYALAAGIDNSELIDWVRMVSDKAVEGFYYTLGYALRKIGIGSDATLLADGSVSVPLADGADAVFDTDVLHVRTVDSLSGLVNQQFAYDDTGRAIAMEDRFGNKTRLERDGSGKLTAVVAPTGLRTTLEIDGNGSLNAVRYADGSRYTFAYDDLGRLTEKTQPNGASAVVAYDDEGRVTSEEDAFGALWQFATAVDKNQTLAEVTYPSGDLWRYLSYLGSGGSYVLDRKNPDGSLASRHITYSETNQSIQSCSLAIDITKQMDIVAGMRIPERVLTTSPGGLKHSATFARSYERNATSVTKVTDTLTVNGNAKTTTLDLATGEKVTISAEGRRYARSYNPATGQLETVGITGYDPMQFLYDERGRITKVAQGTRQYGYRYDANGRLEALLDSEENELVSYEYDAMGRVVLERDALGQETGYAYDAAGNLVTLTTPRGKEYGFTYDALNRLYTTTSPLNGEETQSFTEDRRLDTVTLPSGDTIRYAYTDGKLTERSVGTDRTLVTQGCGGITQLTRGTESVTVAYDAFLPTALNSAGTLNASVGFVYSDALKLSSLSYAGGTVDYTRDKDGLITKLGRYDLLREGNDKILLTTVQDGTYTKNIGYDRYGDVTTVDGGAYAFAITARDKEGRITQLRERFADANVTHAYAYTKNGELESVSKDGIEVERYRFDANGNRVSATSTLRGVDNVATSFTDDDAVDAVGTTVYRYDANGRLSTKTVPAGDYTYDYSPLGELDEIRTPEGDTIKYVYDPFGRRIAKKLNGTVVRKYLWLGRATLLAVYDGTDALLQRYEYAGARVPVAAVIGAQRYYLHYNHVGSLRAVTDGAGTIVKRLDYDSFGNLLSDSNPALEISLGFAGGIQDGDSGLVLFGLRDYDPDTGRWTAKDPIGFAGGDINLYRYVTSDPVNRIDPLGTYSVGNLWSDTKNVARGMADGARNAASGAWEGTKDIASDVVDGASAIAGDIDDALGISDGIKAGTGMLGDAMDAVGEDLGDLAQNVRDMVPSDLLRQGKNKLADGMNAVKDGVSDAMDDIKNLPPLWNLLDDVFNDDDNECD